MDYNQFKFNLLLRIAAISFSAFLLAEFIQDSLIQLSTLLICALIIFQLFSLLKFLDINRELIVQFIKQEPSKNQVQSDTPAWTGEEDQELIQRYNLLQQKLSNLRNEKDAQSQYLKTIVQHLGIGLMTFDRTGNIQIINTTAKKTIKGKTP